ncbi:Uncharacterized protein TCM_042909 [Theobroma cacao]|uniref:Uncharacterized protein n=1 Tax=Theobroma cacao TaxID=3641 RepID=A0A061FLX8_THECC|nr:Uncharacterized protein TCM_042909 [Theobroma cacao]
MVKEHLDVPFGALPAMMKHSAERDSIGDVAIVHHLCEANSFVDALAKYGVDTDSMFAAWWSNDSWSDICDVV